MSRHRDHARERDRPGDRVAYLARWAHECASCGKKCYPSRKMARAVARVLYPQRKMRAYACGPEFHLTSYDAVTAATERRQAAVA